MEINGLANIHILLNQVEFMSAEGSLDEEHLQMAVESIKKQLELLERYMIAVSEDKKLFWHEVLQDPKKYPTLKERVNI